MRIVLLIITWRSIGRVSNADVEFDSSRDSQIHLSDVTRSEKLGIPLQATSHPGHTAHPVRHRLLRGVKFECTKPSPFGTLLIAGSKTARSLAFPQSLADQVLDLVGA
jgi:hypothetical protein